MSTAKASLPFHHPAAGQASAQGGKCNRFFAATVFFLACWLAGSALIFALLSRQAERSSGLVQFAQSTAHQFSAQIRSHRMATLMPKQLPNLTAAPSASVGGRPHVFLDFAADSAAFSRPHLLALESAMRAFPSAALRLFQFSPGAEGDCGQRFDGRELPASRLAAVQQRYAADLSALCPRQHLLTLSPDGPALRDAPVVAGNASFARYAQLLLAAQAPDAAPAPFHVRAFAAALALWRRGGVFSDLSFFFLAAPPPQAEGFYFNSFCVDGEADGGPPRVFRPQPFESWPLRHCATAALLVFPRPRSPLVTCALSAFASERFSVCVDSDAYFAGAGCVRDAFARCFAAAGSRNALRPDARDARDAREAEAPDVALEAFGDDPLLAERRLLVERNWTLLAAARVVWLGRAARGDPPPAESLLAALVRRSTRNASAACDDGDGDSDAAAPPPAALNLTALGLCAAADDAAAAADDVDVDAANAPRRFAAALFAPRAADANRSAASAAAPWHCPQWQPPGRTRSGLATLAPTATVAACRHCGGAELATLLRAAADRQRRAARLDARGSLRTRPPQSALPPPLLLAPPTGRSCYRRPLRQLLRGPDADNADDAADGDAAAAVAECLPLAPASTRCGAPRVAVVEVSDDVADAVGPLLLRGARVEPPRVALLLRDPLDRLATAAERGDAALLWALLADDASDAPPALRRARRALTTLRRAAVGCLKRRLLRHAASPFAADADADAEAAAERDALRRLSRDFDRWRLRLWRDAASAPAARHAAWLLDSAYAPPVARFFDVAAVAPLLAAADELFAPPNATAPPTALGCVVLRHALALRCACDDRGAANATRCPFAAAAADGAAAPAAAPQWSQPLHAALGRFLRPFSLLLRALAAAQPPTAARDAFLAASAPWPLPPAAQPPPNATAPLRAAALRHATLAAEDAAARRTWFDAADAELDEFVARCGATAARGDGDSEGGDGGLLRHLLPQR